MGLVMDVVVQFHQRMPFEKSPKFNGSIKYNCDINANDARQYWEDALEDYDDTPFPLFIPVVIQPFTDMSEEILIHLPQAHGSGVTIAALIRAA